MELVLRQICVEKNNANSAQTEYKYAPQFLDCGMFKPVGDNHISFLHCRQFHQWSVHRRIPPSPHMSQRTVPIKDNSEHRVKQLRGQRQPEEGYWRAIAKDFRTLGVHHRRSTHCQKRWEDIRRWSKKTAEGSAGDGLPTWGCPSNHDPPDVQDPGGGLP
ncbi:hypothetical protein NDU88_010558 [Pleurodeles waltl]|uniref:Myb/SANT-like DNA-binding domain-containing protein n=1 Tax=Pleurodeles waltl TaxID=8319 RepID=A0AAV7QXV0_PLEWA|nr:hypothetical protein NDU88_010558 [Pleurodeles waltl]